jgi:hypothetical protein
VAHTNVSTGATAGAAEAAEVASFFPWDRQSLFVGADKYAGSAGNAGGAKPDWFIVKRQGVQFHEFPYLFYFFFKNTIEP